MRIIKLTALAFSIAFGLSACGGGDSSEASGSKQGTGNFSLSITDGPVDTANQVVIAFDHVLVKPKDGEALAFNFDEPKSIDLLKLTGNISESLLEGVELPSGDYSWIRLGVLAEFDGVLDSFIELSDGAEKELRVPSGSQTGLKINHNFTINEDSPIHLVVDFDLRKSVTDPPGQSGAILKPVLRVVEANETGIIAGTVAPELIGEACENPSENDGAVYVFSGADITPTDLQEKESDAVINAFVELNDGAYAYEAGFVEPGEYTIAFTCNNNIDDPKESDEVIFYGTTNVDVIATETTSHDFPYVSNSTK